MAQPAKTEGPVKFGEAAKEPKPLEIASNRVTISDAGQSFRNVFVRMPEGMTADHVRDPKIWKLAQQSRQSALMKFDHLFIVTFDEGQYIRALVTHATATEAHLAIEKVGTFREQGQSFFTDGTLEVFWDGAGYSFRRMSDKVRLESVSHTTEGGAIEALRKWYGTKAA